MLPHNMTTLIQVPEVGQPPRLAYRLPEAANLIGLSPRTIRRLVKRGLLRPSRASQRFIFSHKELTRFLEETTSA